MDCRQVQQVVTAALGAGATAPAELEEAKRHCRTCGECGRFVTAQLVLKRSLVAEPPSDLADRVMATVRAEAEATNAEEERDAQVAAAVLASQLDAASTAARLRRPARTGSRSTTWFAAAAGLFVLLGVGALLTATVMSGSLSGQRASTLAYEESAPQASAPMTGEAVAPEASKDAAALGGASISGPAFVTVNGIVYSFKGDSAVSRSTLAAVGSTSSSLDSGSAAPISLTVLAAQGSTGQIYVEYSQRLLEFEKVTREYEGRVYALRSGTIPGFGVWPSLPTEIAQPAAADGSPSLESAEASGGATVFVKAGSDASAGIAFPPGAAGPGPISGAPVWTWWTAQ